jgi:hypothetical protein
VQQAPPATAGGFRGRSLGLAEGALGAVGEFELKTPYEVPSPGGGLDLKPAGNAQNHLFLGNRSADFMTSWMHALAKIRTKGILGDLD